jgi:hypothetical protein
MTLGTIIILLLSIVAIGLGISYFLTRDNKTSTDKDTPIFPEYNEEEKELAKLVMKQYNQPVVAPELTVEEPEFVKKEETTPVKKKRKYYPKKKAK